MILAIFDFDGTITKKDSFVEFIFYTHGTAKTFLNGLVLSPILILYFLKILPNWKTKEIFLTYFYKGWDKKRFNAAALNYSQKKLPQIIKKSAMEKLQWHKKEEHKVVVVSASFENYLQPWCQKEGLDLIATKVEFIDNKISGNFMGKNCYGEEKISRIKEKYNLKSFDCIYAYGDSKGDLALKNIASEFHYKTFQ